MGFAGYFMFSLADTDKISANVKGANWQRRQTADGGPRSAVGGLENGRVTA
jgi:hypothetical protein